MFIIFLNNKKIIPPDSMTLLGSVTRECLEELLENKMAAVNAETEMRMSMKTAAERCVRMSSGDVHIF